MTEQEIERCLERFATCKATDVMNFDYTGTLEYIRRIKFENERLEAENKRMLNQIAHMVTPPCELGDILYMPLIAFQDGYDDDGNAIHKLVAEVKEITVERQNFYQMCDRIERNRVFFSEEEANKNLQYKLDALKGVKNDD